MEIFERAAYEQIPQTKKRPLVASVRPYWYRSYGKKFQQMFICLLIFHCNNQLLIDIGKFPRETFQHLSILYGSALGNTS